MYLYIDTTHNQFIGLLDEKFTWTCLKQLHLKKASNMGNFCKKSDISLYKKSGKST